MVMPQRWKRSPKPDQSVLELVAALHEAAQSGQLRALVVVTMNPNLEIETGQAGITDKVRKRLLSSGLSELTIKLLSSE